MTSDKLNPMENIYKEFVIILNNMTIKYNYEAEKYETMATKQSADGFIDAYYKRDNFLTYRDYNVEEYNSVGIYDTKLIAKASEEIRVIPEKYRDALLELRRAREIRVFEEQNDYYRMLNGFPSIDVDPSDYHYVSSEIADMYEISMDIPIHKIQDYYNKIESGKGDKLINILEGIKYIEQLKKKYPNEKYLNFLGSNRITLAKARSAKNFEILRLKHESMTAAVYDSFIELYEQCREYFMTTIYNSQFRSFFSYYDNFIGMCIMLMATQQLIVKQIPYASRRNFFDIYSLKLLYETYNVPYDLTIDSDTQRSIAQNLNMIICNKSTNKVIYDIADLLGFSNLKVYKYYLAKEHKYDDFGVPIMKYTSKFNSDTGEYVTVPDYEAMYELYFQKEELNNDDFIQTFNNKVNMVSYDEVTKTDPYWLEDQLLYTRKWESVYNFVETKYLSLGISYRMTDILFENVLLLKLMMKHNSPLKDVTLAIPKIMDGTRQPIFDLVILLLAMVAKKHSLTGEIITIPTQVISVLDYLQNVDGGSEYLVDTFSFNFDYFNTVQSEKDIDALAKLLDESDAKLFRSYLSVLSFDSDATVEEKLKTLNSMYKNIKNLAHFISYKMTDVADKATYDALRTFYKAAFYSKEMKSLFTIEGELTGQKRTAKNYFEFLYYYNPKLYNAVFKVDFETSYQEYLTENNIPSSTLSFTEYRKKIELGEIDISYDGLNIGGDEESETALNTMYYYINHIISRFKLVIENINFLYLIEDSSASLVELLVKIIQFVKSMTTDMIGLDTVYICNIKPENLLRFVDHIHYMQKDINIEDSLNLSYSDSIHRIDQHVELSDSLKLEDTVQYTSDMEVREKDDSMYLTDRIHEMWYSD